MSDASNVIKNHAETAYNLFTDARKLIAIRSEMARQAMRGHDEKTAADLLGPAQLNLAKSAIAEMRHQLGAFGFVRRVLIKREVDALDRRITRIEQGAFDDETPTAPRRSPKN